MESKATQPHWSSMDRMEEPGFPWQSRSVDMAISTWRRSSDAPLCLTALTYHHPSRWLMKTKQQSEIIRRLRCAAGHLNAVIEMTENGGSCEKVLHQLNAVEAALQAAGFRL